MNNRFGDGTPFITWKLKELIGTIMDGMNYANPDTREHLEAALKSTVKDLREQEEIVSEKDERPR